MIGDSAEDLTLPSSVEAMDEAMSQQTLRNTAGMVPRCAVQLLRAIASRRRRWKSTYRANLWITYVQVFGDEVTDLLRAPGSAQEGEDPVIWRHMAARIIGQGDLRVAVEDPKSLEGLLRRAEAAKRRAATAMNERSSRCAVHSLLTAS